MVKNYLHPFKKNLVQENGKDEVNTYNNLHKKVIKKNKTIISNLVYDQQWLIAGMRGQERP